MKQHYATVDSTLKDTVRRVMNNKPSNKDKAKKRLLKRLNTKGSMSTEDSVPGGVHTEIEEDQHSENLEHNQGASVLEEEENVTGDQQLQVVIYPGTPVNTTDDIINIYEHKMCETSEHLDSFQVAPVEGEPENHATIEEDNEESMSYAVHHEPNDEADNQMEGKKEEPSSPVAEFTLGTPEAGEETAEASNDNAEHDENAEKGDSLANNEHKEQEEQGAERSLYRSLEDDSTEV